jgi:hypothetical protein
VVRRSLVAAEHSACAALDAAAAETIAASRRGIGQAYASAYAQIAHEARRQIGLAVRASCRSIEESAHGALATACPERVVRRSLVAAEHSARAALDAAAAETIAASRRGIGQAYAQIAHEARRQIGLAARASRRLIEESARAQLDAEARQWAEIGAFARSWNGGPPPAPDEAESGAEVDWDAIYGEALRGLRAELRASPAFQLTPRQIMLAAGILYLTLAVDYFAFATVSEQPERRLYAVAGLVYLMFAFIQFQGHRHD